MGSGWFLTSNAGFIVSTGGICTTACIELTRTTVVRRATSMVLCTLYTTMDNSIKGISEHVFRSIKVTEASYPITLDFSHSSIKASVQVIIINYIVSKGYVRAVIASGRQG